VGPVVVPRRALNRGGEGDPLPPRRPRL